MNTLQRMSLAGFKSIREMRDPEFKPLKALIYTEEAVVWHKDGYPRPDRTVLGFGVEKALLNDPERQKDTKVKVVRGLLSGARVYQFHDTSTGAPLRSKCKVDDNRYLFDHGGNPTPLFFYLRERKRETYDLILSTIQQGAPFFEDVSGDFRPRLAIARL